MTQNFNNTSIDDRILSLRKELDAVIEAFDPFDENKKNVVEKSLNLTQKMLKRGSRTTATDHQQQQQINIDQQNKSSEKSFKKCKIK